MDALRTNLKWPDACSHLSRVDEGQAKEALINALRDRHLADGGL